MVLTAIALLVSFLLALLTIPLFSLIARRIGLVDNPDYHRKLHRAPIPMVGGLALIILVPLTTIVAINIDLLYPSMIAAWSQGVSKAISPQLPVAELAISRNDLQEFSGLLLAALVLFLVGVADDRFNIRGRHKLLGQILAVTVLIFAGFKFDHFFVFGYQIDFGILSVFVIYAWTLAAINSINLLDGADGIAGTIGFIMSLAICAMALFTGKVFDAIVSAAIAGTLCGFLRFNFPPAKAYLGDAGSMLIGLLLSALAVRCTFKYSASYAFIAPLALLAIPFIDTLAAIVRRRLTGRSIFATDRGHLHHTLMKRGYGPKVSLLWVAMFTSTTSAGAVLTLVYRNPAYALISIGIVMFVMIFCRIFGWAEYQLINQKTFSLARSFFRLGKKDAADVMEGSVHVQGNRNWKAVWTLLYDFADENSLQQLTLDVNAPWLHESFHATRRLGRNRVRDESREWSTVIPIVVQQKVCGRVELHGIASDSFSHQDVIRNLLKVLADIEYSLGELGGRFEPSAASELVGQNGSCSEADKNEFLTAEAGPSTQLPR